MPKAIYQRDPYEPLIPPERVMRDEKAKLIDALRGTDGCVRKGEEYIATCNCGELIVTSDWPLADKFMEKHDPHWQAAGVRLRSE